MLLSCLVLAACEHESSSVPERRVPVIVAEVPADASVAPVIADAVTFKPAEPPSGPAPKIFDDKNRRVLDAIIDRNSNAGAFGTLSGVGTTAKGTLVTGSSTTANELDRKIKEHAGLFQACYTQELAKGHDLGGKVKLSFTISGTGAVAKATATGMDAAVEACLVRVVKRIKFDAPADGKLAHVTYPLTFTSP